MSNKNEKSLILMHGVPGSGKSSFVAKTFRWQDTNVICPDDIREEFKDKKEQWKEKFEHEIWKIVTYRVRESLKKNRITVIDATFISRGSIRREYKVMQQVDPSINFVIIDFSDKTLEECLENNRKRRDSGGRFVSEEVIEDMYKRIKRVNLLEFEPMVVSHKDFGDENE